MDTFRLSSSPSSSSSSLMWWIITTILVQTASCASVNSNFDHTTRQQPFTASLARASNTASSAASIEPLCTDEFVHEREVLSSLTLELHPSAAVPGPCKSLLTASESNVFIVRLQRIRVGRSNVGPVAMMTGGHSGGAGSSGGRQNMTRSCPLSIISTSDPLKSPWKVDPCLLDDMSAASHISQDEPVQMLPGRLRIIWHHGGNVPNYRLVVTALGKGASCLQPNKHACLRFGSEIMLCISESLVCDGTRHCPTGNGYDSDEDSDMCLRYKANKVQTYALPSELGLWQQISKELQKIIPSSSTEMVTDEVNTTDDMPNAKSNGPHRTGSTLTGGSSPEVQRTKEARERTSLTRGLSRYGPWGYLMLGMLLCGGALLMCGMWECCCRTKKNDPNGDDPVAVSTESADANGTVSTHNGTASVVEPPNYDEIDPPPSYAALFPHQKIESTTSTAESPAASTATSSNATSSTPTTSTTNAHSRIDITTFTAAVQPPQSPTITDNLTVAPQPTTPSPH